MRTLETLLQRAHPDAAFGAAEAFVLMTLAFFLGMVFAILVGAWVLHRRARRPSPHVQLLMELDKPDRPAPKKAPGQPWERDADWWK
jgi:Fe2+ transport system protein B